MLFVCLDLKKVTADMQTHKNSALRQGPAPFKAPTQKSVGYGSSAPVDKPPSFVRDGKKWLIVRNKPFKLYNFQMNDIFFCRNTKKATIICLLKMQK